MTLPLHDKLFISTRPKDSSDELAGLLSREGAVVAGFPLIEVQPARLSETQKSLFHKLDQFQWIVFTSSNGIHHFFTFLKEITGGSQLPATLKVAVIGKKTEAILQEYGYEASFVNPGSTSEEFSGPFLKHLQTGNMKPNVLLPLGNLARTVIQENLKNAAHCTRIDLYNTVVPQQYDGKVVQQIEKGDYDMLIFTSPSGIRNLLTLAPDLNKEEVRMACIGQVTYHEAVSKGFKPLVTAQTSSAQGIVDSILNYYISKK